MKPRYHTSPYPIFHNSGIVFPNRQDGVACWQGLCESLCYSTLLLIYLNKKKVLYRWPIY